MNPASPAKSNILILDIGDKNNYKWLDTYVPPTPISSPVVPTSGSTGTGTPTVTNASTETPTEPSVGIGIIAGGSAIAVVFAIALIASIVLFMRRSKRNNI